MAWFRRPAPDRDLDDEIRFHLSQEQQLRRDRGESEEEAARNARREFGNVLLIKETTRDMWGRRLLGDFLFDVRYGIRMFGRAPVLAAAAIVSLALGIGANTAIFTVVNAVLLRPLPYPEPAQLIAIAQRHARFGLEFATLPDFEDWRDGATTLTAIGGAWTAAFNISGGDEPERLAGAFATPGLFDTFNIRPAIGSTFADRPGDDRQVVVLSDELWRRRFAASPDVIGRRVELNNRAYTVVGVMPPGFAWPNATTMLWMPLVPEASMDRGYHMLQVVARLKPGSTLAEAHAELSTIAAAAANEYPATNKDWGVQTESLHGATVAAAARSLWILTGAAACLLLIACANVASLLASRAVSRRLELSLRSALGASRVRIFRQLLTEGIVLSACGGLAGLAIATAAVSPLLSLTTLPRSQEVSLDWPVFAATLVASLATALIIGLLSAWHASRAEMPDLRGNRASAGAGWLRPLLLAVEVAASVVLLAGSGLLIRSFHHLQQVEVGFDAARLLTMRLFLPRAGYPTERGIQLYQQMIEHAETVRGVQSAAAVSAFPFAGTTPNVGFTIPSQPQLPGRGPSADFASITPGYFRTMGIQLIAGRHFLTADTASAPLVAIVTRSMADRFFPGADPIGQTIRILSQQPRTVVGVVAETRQRTLDAPPAPQIYLPHAQQPLGGMFLVVRAASDRPERLVADVREKIRGLDSTLPIASIKTADELMSGTLSARRFSLVLLTLFSAAALALAMVGIYGVLSFAVSQRRTEIGIRMALGAARTRMLSLMWWQGMWPVLMGLAIGVTVAVAVSPVLAGTLYEIGPRDPITLTGVAVLLLATAGAAAYLPARRASLVDPRTALQ